MFYRDSDGLDPTTKEHVHLCGDGMFVRKLTFHPRSLKLTYSSCLLHAWRPLGGIWSVHREITITIRLRLNRKTSMSPLQAHQISPAGWDVARHIWVSSCGDYCVWQLEEDGRGLDWPERTSPWKAASSEAPGGQPAVLNLETASGLEGKKWGLWLTQAWAWWFTRHIQPHKSLYDSQLCGSTNIKKPIFLLKLLIAVEQVRLPITAAKLLYIIIDPRYSVYIHSKVWSLIFGTLNTPWWQQCNGMTNLLWHPLST